eukprot:COSAG01_NODE_1661_length_9583_cov_37.367356_6_plen_1155_part_00
MRGRDLGRLWAGLHGLTKAIVEHDLHRSDLAENDADEVDTSLQCLQAVATISMNFLMDKKRPLPDSMKKTVQLMHDVMLQLTGDTGWALQNDISRTCEDMWNGNRAGRESVVTQTLPYLVAKCLDVDGKVGDLKRLYTMRASLLLLEFQDPSIDSLKDLLLRCFAHPLFLKTADGRKFCVYCFGLHPSFIAEIHATIKQQLPYASKHSCELFGEIYFKAWRSASGPYLVRIESGCVQNLMSAAVHASTMSLFTALRRVLGAFHQQKKAQGVDEMLLRLYAPIIWRALAAANPHVRRSAATLLIDTFPLHDPDSSLEAMDEILQKQFDCLRELLVDPTVAVRVVGVSGICRVLCVYWEVIPPATTQAFLKLLVQQSAHDANAAALRMAVCEGLGYLLDNQLSHLALRDCLPHLSFLIHDRSPKVRSAFVSLLLRIKHVRTIRFYNVVPIPDLLSRLAAECSSGDSSGISATAAGLVDLLLNSYMPYEKDPTTQLRRCLSLCKKNSRAAVVFYRSIFPWVPATASVSLGCQLLHFAEAAMEVGVEGAADAHGLGGGEDTENQAEPGGEGEGSGKPSRKRQKKTKAKAKATAQLSAKEIEIVVACLEVAIELFGHQAVDDGASAEEQAEADAAAELVAGAVTEAKLVKMLAAISMRGNARAWSALIHMAALLPATALPQLCADCAAQLAALPEQATPSEFEPLLCCMSAWGHTDQIFSLLSAALGANTSPLVARVAAKRARNEAADAAGGAAPRPALALRVIDFMLATPSLSAALTAPSAQPLRRGLQESLQSAIAAHVEGVAAQSDADEACWADETALDALLVYAKLLLRALVDATPTSEPSMEAAADAMCSFFNWASEALGAYVAAAAEADDDDGALPPFVPQACQLLLAVAAESHVLGIFAKLDSGCAMALWQSQHEFALAALRSSHNVSAPTLAAVGKLLVQAHDGWTRQVDGVDMPCVPKKKATQLLCGMGTRALPVHPVVIAETATEEANLTCRLVTGTHAEPDTVWSLRMVFVRLINLYKKLPAAAYSDFIAKSLTVAALAALPPPEPNSAQAETALETESIPAAMAALVELLRQGQNRQRSAFMKLGRPEVLAVMATLEQRLLQASSDCLGDQIGGAFPDLHRPTDDATTTAQPAAPAQVSQWPPLSAA